MSQSHLDIPEDIQKERSEKISKSLKGHRNWMPKDFVIWNKGIPCSQETKDKLSKANKGKVSPRKGVKLSEETKQKLSESHKGWIPPKSWYSHCLKRRPMSGLEIKVQKAVKKYHLPYKFVGNGQFVIERKVPDFINTNGQKIAVEVYSKVQKENVRGIPVDEWKKERSEIFSKYGWSIIYIEDWQTNKEETIVNLLTKGGN